MDGREFADKAIEFFKKFRYAAIILLAGLFFMLLPAGGKENSMENIPMETTLIQESISFEEKLEEILSHVEGAGHVRVFLSQASGEEVLYQTDEDASSDTLRRSTVVITGSDRQESGLVRQINPAQYQGAIVLCQGADSAAIRLSITQAVANATGLGADQISVLKMK